MLQKEINTQSPQKGTPVGIMADFSIDTLKARIAQNNVLPVLGIHKSHFKTRKITCPTWIRMTFNDTNGLKDLISTKPTLKRILVAYFGLKMEIHITKEQYKQSK